MTRIAVESPDQPEVMQLVDELDAYQKPLYPEESHHGIDIAALLAANVVFCVARDSDGVAVGCGALVIEDGWAELKRMFVRPAFRGHGVARDMLCFLEAQALGRGVATVRLETGVRQPEALRLYEKAGYRPREPFGCYGVDPHSTFMEKPLQ